MNPCHSRSAAGVALHAVGALFVADLLCAAEHVRRWSWEMFWITQAAFCWFLLPIIGAILTIPRPARSAAPKRPEAPMAIVPAGHGLRHRRHGLQHLDPLHRLLADLRHRRRPVQRAGHADPAAGERRSAGILGKPGAGWVMAGVAVGTVGIALCGSGGPAQRSRPARPAEGQPEFSLAEGAAAVAAGRRAVGRVRIRPRGGRADRRRGRPVRRGRYRGNVAYIFANTGAFLTTAVTALSERQAPIRWAN